MLKKMKKKPFQIAMVTCSTLAMLLISAFALNISTMILLLLAALAGIIVFAVGDSSGKERVKDDLS